MKKQNWMDKLMDKLYGENVMEKIFAKQAQINRSIPVITKEDYIKEYKNIITREKWKLEIQLEGVNRIITDIPYFNKTGFQELLKQINSELIIIDEELAKINKTDKQTKQ